VNLSRVMNGLGIPRSLWYQWRKAAAPDRVKEPAPRKPSPRALTPEEKTRVLSVLNSPEYQDLAVPQVYASLLDRGEYLCSISSQYRILRENSQVRERRNQLRHPDYPKPVLVATKPDQVWTWDITKLLGPYRGIWFYLYTVLDMFSRYVVGWMVAERETGDLARELVERTCELQKVDPYQLALHSDRGDAMTSKTLTEKMEDLKVRLSYSRPRVSNDNPYSEAQFKTMKYRPDYPLHFGSVEDARCWARGFFRWYNHEHYHSGIGLMPPAVIYYGLGEERWEERQEVLADFYQLHPERFVKGKPHPPFLPRSVWINPPKDTTVCRSLEKGAILTQIDHVFVQ
jgi:putative transposase